MQATAVIPTGDNIIRGLLSEFAVARNLEMLKTSHARFGLPRILNIIPVLRGETPGGKHADYLVEMLDGKETVQVPLEVKSSDRCAMVFRKKCKVHGWGDIPTVVVYPSERILDYSWHLIRRAAEQLIEGFKLFRRKLCNQIALRRNPALKKKKYRHVDHFHHQCRCSAH